MLTHAARLLLAHTLKPFTFKLRTYDQLEFRPGPLGLYVHIPFCRSICDFCPYNKELYTAEAMDRCVAGIQREIRWAREAITGPVEVASTYFGGGTPALAVDHLAAIQRDLTDAFGDRGSIGGSAENVGSNDRSNGIELHPDDLDPATVGRLAACGFNMASVGIQSFDPEALTGIGRSATDITDGFAALHREGFGVIDVDLIFGLPGQTARGLTDDFRRAAEMGATQISTYPFISFSYTGRTYPRIPRRRQLELLSALGEVAVDLGWERTSVWTFAKPHSGRYSSVTRENFLGFGPSAASLLADSFKINTFSVDAYAKQWHSDDEVTGRQSLSMAFSDRTRALYWLFWACYRLKIDASEYRAIFGQSLEAMFGRELRFARLAGLMVVRGENLTLTSRGAYYFHLVEQKYTQQYIDKTWRTCVASPWPEAFRLW